MTKILAFSGSSSSRSINQKLVTFAASLLPDGMADVVDIRDYPLPIYSIDIEEGEGIPANAEKFKALMREYDGYLISSPEHNGLVPAIFKNLIDWLSRLEGKVFDNKPVVLMSTSPGKVGGRTNLEKLEKLLPRWGGEVVGSYSVGNFNDVFDDETMAIADEEHLRAIRSVVALLKDAVRHQDDEKQQALS
jgi:NAD(P)H-dependent FMN reductase